MTHPSRRRAASIVAVVSLALAGCPGRSPSSPADGSPDAFDATPTGDAPMPDVPDDVTDPPQPTGPGSTAALLDEACAGRDRTGPATLFACYTGGPVSVLRNTQAGDSESVHLVVTEPVRIERIRVYMRGAAGGQALVHLQDDYGRSQPDIAHDLIAPMPVAWERDGWIDLPLRHPVDLHPARHAWITVEHVTEPMGVAFARTDGADFRSFFHVQYYIDANASSPGADTTFEWFPIGDDAGNRYEYMAEAHGALICPRDGAPWFTDVATSAGIAITSGDTNWVDVDGDGWDDVAGVGGDGGHEGPLLFRNRHDGTFTSITAQSGLDAVSGREVIYGDFDGDGDLDAYVGVYRDGLPPFDPPFPSRVYLQGSDRRFTVVDAPLEPAGPTAAGALADCDGDGHLDLVVGQWLRQYPRNPAPDFLFHGRGDGLFDNITATAGLPARGDMGPTYGAAFADWDNDGDQDLFIANYGGNPNFAWRNDGHCHFTSIGPSIHFDQDDYGIAGTTFGHEFGDYDNDGDLDAFETDIGHPRYDGRGTDHSRLLRNGGAPGFVFEDATAAAGIIYTEGDISSAWGDYDNDGDLDLYVSTTYPFEFSRLYRQDADHSFTDVTWRSGTVTDLNGRGRWCDYDRDGDLDFLTGARGRNVLFRNELPAGNHWLEIRLAMTAGNTEAIGARITARTSDGMSRVREVNGAQTHHAAQGPRMQHFGLGAVGGPLNLEVRWPDGTRTMYANVAPDHAYRILQGQQPQQL